MTLLEMALAAPTPPPGQAVTLAGAVTLRNTGSQVVIQLAEYPATVTISYRTPWGWVRSAGLAQWYARWAENARIWYDMHRGKKRCALSSTNDTM